MSARLMSPVVLETGAALGDGQAGGGAAQVQSDGAAEHQRVKRNHSPCFWLRFSVKRACVFHFPKMAATRSWFSATPVALLCVALVALAPPAHAFYEKGSDVINLRTSKDLARIAKSPHLWMVELYREV